MAAEQDKPPENSAKSAEEPKKAEEQKPKSSAPILLKGEIKIFPDRRLPEYDLGAVKAYEAQGGNGAMAVALVCEKNLVPQTELAHKYTGIITPHLPKLIACTVVEWSLDGKERLIFVYDCKLGKPVTEGKNPLALGLKTDAVISTIFRNVLEVVRAMRDKGIAHGNIRATNIFNGGTPTFENAMLGEMLATPSGYCQPVLYETIVRGLSHPLGKGPAEISDDIYALGVTLATLIRTTEAAEGLTDEQIVLGKMESGSFNFIVGKSRFPAPVLEFLRGTLNDEPDQRWTFDDIMTWAEGRRVTAKQTAAAATLKASRPLEFMRQKFLKPELLSTQFPKDPTQVVPLVENGELYLWLNRSIQNKELEKRYDDALIEAKKEVGNTNIADRMSCLMAIALEPRHPMFYKDLKFFPMGFGSLLADAVGTRRSLNAFVDIMQAQMASFWSKCYPDQSQGVGETMNRLSNCQRFVTQSMPGSGLERCVYYLSPTAPCFSEKLDAYYVRSADDYIRALEKMSGSKSRPEWFLDRHIIAFLSVRDKSVIEPYLPDLTSTDKQRQRQGVIKMLSAIQIRDKVEPLPGLSLWLVGMLDALVDKYHDREKRKAVREQMEKVKNQGNLEKISSLFDNYAEVQKDQQNFGDMMRQFQALRKEYFMLEHELETNKKFGMEAGKQTAAIVSGIISLAVVTVYLLFALTRGGGSVF